MRKTSKELIAEARVTARTLPPAAAKLMSTMADRLDVQFVALCESRNEAKQLAGENALMKSAIKTHSESVHFCVSCGKDDPCSNDDVCYALEETPATDAFLASLHAEHLQNYADSIAARMKDKSQSLRQKERLNFAWAEAKAYAAELHNTQLRSKSEVPS